MATIEPSQQRLSRIAAALSLDRTNLTPEEVSDLDESQEEERDEFNDVVDISDEALFDESEQGISVELESEINEMKEESRLSDEETEMRRTAQALFELEESLLDQHISNIKVSFGTFGFLFWHFHS